MRTLICPVSSLRVDEHVVRVTGLMMALMIALYALTGLVIFPLLLTIDYGIRAFTALRYSPFSWLAAQIVQGTGIQPVLIDKAPKIFASRVGFLFILAATLLFFVAPTASLLVALTLMGFAILESVFNFCVGCVVYTYLVLPFFSRRPSP